MQVFISYVAADKAVARRIAKALADSGLQPWLDEQHLMPGEDWHAAVSQALNESDAMVLVLSPAALASNWVSNEIDFALGHRAYKNRVIPVLVGMEPEEIPWILRGMHLVRLQGEDAEALREIPAALLRAA